MRLEKDAYFLRHATIAAQMSTCERRSVGCVLINARRQILAVGFNGVPSGMPHCNEGHPCPGVNSPSGTNLSNCFATHAEVNAVIQCRDPYAIDTVYTTTSPCVDCTKFLMNTSAKRIVFVEAYPHSESQRLWEGVGREWVHLPLGPGGHWVGKPTCYRPILTGTKANHAETCDKCQGSGWIRVPDNTPEQIKLIELRAAREECRGGGYAGRIKAGIIDAQIRRLEMPPIPDQNCSTCKGSGKITASIGGGWAGYDDEERPCGCVK